MYLSGRPGEPMKAYVPWVDFGTATNAAFATLAALYARRTTGKGQHVEASLLRTALTVSNAPLSEQRVRKLDRVASGNRSQIAGPSDSFRTRDGWILAQVIGQPLFERWCKLTGATEWLADPRFASDPARGEHGALLSERMGRWCAARTSADALAALEAAGIPAGPIYSPQEAVDDPHVRAAQILVDSDYPGLPVPAPISSPPARFSASDVAIRRRAPQLGEHTEQVLRELAGYRDDEIASLRAGGVI
jgi:crotonobetainyl-CoA:carnitine CoA-transferase CaiB-like acyl-CoA transferase